MTTIGTKHALEDTTYAPGPSKTLRTSLDPLSLTPAQLQATDKDIIIQHVTDLQVACRKLQADKLKGVLAAKTTAASNAIALANAAPPGTKLSEEAIALKVISLASVMGRGIEKQMKWQPSCKRGGTRFAYDGMVPSPEVFYKLFNLEEGKKAWKQKKIPLEDFHKITGYLSASIRYGSLNIVSQEISIKWDKDTCTFKVSGLYGL